jgi:multidrug transporter EmrE-like cation transporter
MKDYLYILGTIFFTVYGQIILKLRVSSLGWSLPKSGIKEMALSYIKFLFDPFVFSGFISAFIASIFWLIAMTKFELTFAYPFMSLAPSIVFILGIIILGEEFTIGKILGLIFIITGIIITVKL